MIAAIKAYMVGHNRDPKKFVWTKRADAILEKSTRCKEALGTAD